MRQTMITADFRKALEVCLCMAIVAIVGLLGFFPASRFSVNAEPLNRYQWPLSPVDRYVLSGQNDFGTYTNHQSNYYHAGMDLRSGDIPRDLEIRQGYVSEYVTPVTAVADGVVKAVYRTPDTVYRCGGEDRDDSDTFLSPSGTVNRGLGNVVVLEHPENVYSLYGHLDCTDPAVVPGAKVSRGAVIGKMGRSTTVRRAESASPHLHFEIKDVIREDASPDELLGDPMGGIYWGYTPDLPTGYGYHDPRTFIHPSKTAALPPIPVYILGGSRDLLNVRTGPGKQFPRVTRVRAGQQYIARQAFQKGRERWYAIDLPHARGTTVGWIAGQHSDCPGDVCAVEDPTAMQIEVLRRTKIRAGHRSDSTPVKLHDKIYDCLRDVYARPGLRFVSNDEPREGLGCTGSYFAIDLPDTLNPYVPELSAAKGWICGDHLSVVPSPPRHRADQSRRTNP